MRANPRSVRPAPVTWRCHDSETKDLEERTQAPDSTGHHLPLEGSSPAISYQNSETCLSGAIVVVFQDLMLKLRTVTSESSIGSKQLSSTWSSFATDYPTHFPLQVVPPYIVSLDSVSIPNRGTVIGIGIWLRRPLFRIEGFLSLRTPPLLPP